MLISTADSGPRRSRPPEPHDTRRYELPMRTYSTLPRRFRSKIRRSGSCWIWQGAKTSTGYGHLSVGSKPAGTRRFVKAHRFAYEALIAPIPSGFQIDHRCRTLLCVNPAHLEPVSAKENARRGLTNVRKTHCPQGHPYDTGNTYMNQGRRYCRECSRLATPGKEARRKPRKR